jgi:hypothetical protein
VVDSGIILLKYWLKQPEERALGSGIDDGRKL